MPTWPRVTHHERGGQEAYGKALQLLVQLQDGLAIVVVRGLCFFALLEGPLPLPAVSKYILFLDLTTSGSPAASQTSS